MQLAGIVINFKLVSFVTINKKAIMAVVVLLGLLVAAPAWAVRLNWEDKSNNETGFSIQQHGPGGWSEVDRVLADVEIYTDGVASEGCFRVVAFRNVDGVDIFSIEPSNVGCAFFAPVNFTAMKQ